jgi:hypothetical protein
MNRLIRGGLYSALATGLLTTGMFAGATGVAAKGGNDVIRTGNCSASTDWKLKVGPDDGRMQVEFEVDQNVNGQVWNVTLKRNGSAFWTGQRTTMAPSGSFEVRRLTGDSAGSDTIKGIARNPKTGEVCRTSLAL